MEGPLGGHPDRFVVSARLRWWVAQVDGSFQINQRDARGSYEDFREDLDLYAFDPRSNPGIPEVVLEGRLGGSGLLLHWLETSMEGDSWVNRMVFNGRTFSDTAVHTDVDLRLFRVTYGKHLLPLGFLQGTLLVGIGYIEYRAEVEASPPTPDGPTHTGGNAPFPYFGGRLFLRPPLKGFDILEALLEVTASRGDWGDARLFYLEALLGINVRPIKFISGGFGVHVFHLFADAINVWSEDPDTILVTLTGIYFELEARL
ncbi:MAG: hypothetical protein ACYTHM_07860 [Planctomycetota bacterium]